MVTIATLVTAGTSASLSLVELLSPLDVDLDLDDNHDDLVPLRFRALDNALGPVEIPGLAEHDFMVDEEILLVIGDNEPAMFEEARGEACGYSLRRTRHVCSSAFLPTSSHVPEVGVQAQA
jgi:hypothetical protein